MSDQGQQPPQGQPAGQTPPVPTPPAQQGGQTPPAGQQPPVAQPVPTPPQPPVAQPAAATPAGQQPTGQTPPVPTPPPAQQGDQTPPPAKPAPQPPVPADPNARQGQLGNRSGHVFVIPPHPNTDFDDANFLALLEGSISLTFEEKQRVIDAIPRLSIEQINELISIFEEEKTKFAELEKEFAQDVAKLKKERENELETQQVKIEEQGAADEDAAAAEELKRQMGL